MKIFPLHIKTALLASLISFAVLLVGLVVVSASIARQIQNAQKELALLQVRNLAEQLSSTQDSFDVEGLRNLTNILSGSRPNLVTVRLWTVQNGRFVESVASDDSFPVEDLTEEVRVALLDGSGSSSVRSLPESGDSYFRVLSPIVRGRNVSGAVEGIEKLDTIWSISLSYVANLSWITLLTLFFMGAAFYLLFQRLVYLPLEKLLSAMERVEAGDLEVSVEARPDEFGKLAAGFNSMIGQIREMSLERMRQNETLRLKVREATAEMATKNEQLESANLELFRASRKMSELERLAAAGQTAAQFAHEVGTPLNLISGHVQLLQSRFEAGSKDFERLRTASAQIERIEKIVREMLDRTRFGESVHVPLNLNEILRKIFDAVEATLEERGVELSADLADDLPPIAGDADRLQQVFLNLVSNALDAMPERGRLAVATSADAQAVTVEFSDDGVGMDEETRSRMFRPLFTTKRRGHGTGLGLFVVTQILHEHHAEIDVASEPGKGTRFTIRFDRAKS